MRKVYYYKDVIVTGGLSRVLLGDGGTLVYKGLLELVGIFLP